MDADPRQHSLPRAYSLGKYLLMREKVLDFSVYDEIYILSLLY